MALTENQKIIFEQVLPKMRYDRLLGKYIITYEDYISLNLTGDQMKMLRRACKNNNIELVELPRRITDENALSLFVEYNKIKSAKQTAKNNEEKALLEAKEIEIKQILFTGHMKVLHKIISNKLNNQISNLDKDDIYQTAYISLLEFIDKFDPSRGMSFADYLRHFVIYDIVRKIWQNAGCTWQQEGTQLNRILTEKKKMENKLGRTPNIDELSSLSKIKKGRVEYLLLLNDIINEQNINLLSKELLTEELKDYDFEERIIEKILKENLIKLIDTLALPQKEVILLFYGFVDNEKHTYEEVAKLLGYNSGERVRQIKEEALSKLRHPIISNHFNIDDIKVEDDYSIDELKLAKKQEEYFLSAMPKPVIEKIISSLPEKYHLPLKLYLGVTDGKRYNYEEISKKTGIEKNTVRRMIVKAFQIIKSYLTRKTQNNNPDNYTNKLTQNYLNRK